MRTLTLSRLVAVIVLFTPFAEAQRTPTKKAPAKPAATSTPLTQTLYIDPGISINYPADWSSGQPTLNSWALFNVSAAQLPTASLDTISIRLQITYSVRTDHADAVAQLQEFANEYPTAPIFLTIGGWPALQRVQTIKKPQPGQDADLADQQVIAITTAVAADNLLVRLQGQLPSTADQPTQDLVVAIGQSFAFSSTGVPARVQQELNKLKSAPRPSTSPQRVAALPNLATTLSSGGASAMSVSDATVISPTSTNDPLATRMTHVMAGGGAPIFSLTNIGFNNGELEIAVSNDGKNIVIARQSAWKTSNNGGLTFPFTGNLPVNDGDSSLAFGQSGNFYHSALACFGAGCAPPCPANSTCVEDAVSTNNGQTFGALTNAIVCPNSGGGSCSADQEHIAADRVNSNAGQDRVYMAFRDLAGSANITCSPDSGATWAPRLALEGGSDFPRVTVGQDGTFWVVFRNGGNIRIDKFNACTTSAAQMTRAAGGFPKTVSGFNDIAGCETAGGFPGLDRCNDGNILSSPMVAVDDTNANHIYVSWATNTAANNENVQVADSTNGGVNWRAPVTINGGGSGRRFMPWVCPSGGSAFVTWYDRRAATAGNNDLTDFFAASAGLSAGNLVANNDEFKISTSSDAQCKFWPSAPRSSNDSENCSVQPQNAGVCSITTAIRCDFAGGDGTQCPMGETCKTGGGGPKYGDYNGNACVQGRLYTTFATGAGLTSVQDLFQSFVVSSTPTTVTYTGVTTQDFHDIANLSATLTLSGTSSGIAGQTINFTLGAQSCPGTTNAAGLASCSITLTQIPGGYTVTASFAGSGNFQASANAVPFTIAKEQTTLTYNGDTVVGNGNPAHMSAVLLEDGNAAAPIAGRTVTFTLGTGGSAQTCNGVTNASGVATCTIIVNQPPGSQPVAANFAGDAFYLPASASASLFVPVPPTITKSFADPEVQLFLGITRLSFTITNPNAISLAGIAFTDTLPGLIVLPPDNGLMGSCDAGTITAVPGSNSISLSGATLTAGSSCTFSVLVNGADIGVQNNVTSPITSTTGGGLTGLPASATTSVDDLFFNWFFSKVIGGGGQTLVAQVPAGQ
jgi:hypothetical protein